MAKLTVMCLGACLYFFIFIRINTVFASNGYYQHIDQPQHSFKNDLTLKLLDDEIHLLHKRDVPQTSIQSDTSKTNNSTFNISLNGNRTNLTTSSLNETKLDTKLNQKVPYIFPSNVKRVGTEKDVRLLGVNGTGQRKNYQTTTTIKPTVISTYPPLLHDIPNNKSGKTNFDDFVDNISISKFTDKELEDTLSKHNITNETITETFLYYNSTFITDAEVANHYWVNLSNFENVTTHELLSAAHRRAATVALSFEFPFYGHLIKNVTMATGGFIYTGDYVHAWLAATQYIAPLMANFDTSLSNDSFVRYIDNGTAFTVLWERVSLKDKADAGEFTFQTTLHKNGDIVFVYKNIPMIIENIKDDQHPVKVGLSDAYIIDSTIFFLRRKTIYEYHKVNFEKNDIKNNTVIYLKALPTCLEHKDCESCINKGSSFQCVWCPGLKKCSNGVDRHRQAWLINGCDQNKIQNATYCTKYDRFVTESNPSYIHASKDQEVSPTFKRSEMVVSKEKTKVGFSSVLTVLFIIAMIVGISMWAFYAYKNPHTTSGQMLIRYRPSQWRWKRGEARYTAATIHM